MSTYEFRSFAMECCRYSGVSTQASDAVVHGVLTKLETLSREYHLLTLPQETVRVNQQNRIREGLRENLERLQKELVKYTPPTDRHQQHYTVMKDRLEAQLANAQPLPLPTEESIEQARLALRTEIDKLQEQLEAERALADNEKLWLEQLNTALEKTHAGC